MNCPHCSIELKISERKNIEIDYCPKCRGVWLDRGELDKLLAYSSPEDRPEAHDRTHDRTHDRKRDDDDRYEAGHKPRYRKKSLLGELFDF